MNDKELTHDDFLQRLDIRDVLLDAGYRQNRRFGLRLSSFIRTDSEGKRIRGDKFVITQHGKCCCQPPRQKEYNVVSFIKEHPHLFAEYHEGINPDRLVELVCYRLLHYPIPEQETRTGQPQRDTRPFDIADYNIQKFDPQDRGTQEKFAPYFEKRGIDLCTQQTFHRDFCLATRHSEDGQRRTCLAFPMTLPEDADKIVGFEKRGHAYTDGNSSYDDMTEGNHSGEGVWIASPARTALSEAKHIYWFESASEAMAYYQLHQAKNQELRKAVFVSTGGEPTEKQMRGVLELTIPARQHICFDTGREGWKFAQTLQKEICRTIRSTIEETPERKPYLDSIPDGNDLDEGEFYLLPKGGLQESCIRFDAEREEAISMSSSRLCAPEDVQDQIDTMRKCYREFREKLQDFLGIDKEHDVAISREMPDCRYTGWNEQLLAEQQQESVREESVREEEPEQERQTHFRRDYAAFHTRRAEYPSAAAYRAIRHRRTAADVRVHGGAGVRRHGRSAVEQYGENRFLISAPRVAVSLHLPASDTLQGRRRTACQRTRHFHTQGGLHGTVPYRGLSRTPEPPATDLRVKDGSHSLDGPEHAKARPYRRPMRKRHRGDYP